MKENIGAIIRGILTALLLVAVALGSWPALVLVLTLQTIAIEVIAATYKRH